MILDSAEQAHHFREQLRSSVLQLGWSVDQFFHMAPAVSKRLVIFLGLGLVMSSCTSPLAPTSPWPGGKPFIRFTRSELAAGTGFSCTVAEQRISIRLLNSTGKPPPVLFERRLSPDEFAGVMAIVADSGLLEKMGQDIGPPPRADAVVLTDGAIDSFSFRDGTSDEIRAATVNYWNHRDEAAEKILRSIENLLPEGYQPLSTREAEARP